MNDFLLQRLIWMLIVTTRKGPEGISEIFKHPYHQRPRDLKWQICSSVKAWDTLHEFTAHGILRILFPTSYWQNIPWL